MDKPMDGAVRRGEVLNLVQRSVRRRDYQLRQGDQDLGRLRFTPGRRSLATADTDQTGPLVLTAGWDGIEVRRRDGGATIAIVEGGRRRTMVIRTPDGPALGWRRNGRWQRWTMLAGEADLLHFTAAQGFLKSWVQITVQQDLPEQSALLLTVVGGFLALRELQAEVDASAAIGGIVAASAGS
ncbi:MAG TPA: hypothetical protein VJ735_08395 [Actinomycetes bacterium]|nr:hypothetical protein [Actinomycetes bacterium]